jgi:Fic family protein
MWIYDQKDWPNFIWDDKALSSLLAEARHRQGRLLGKIEGLGFPIRQEASLNILTTDVVTSSAIEGEKLDTDEVRSSIARKLGIPLQNDKSVGRDVEGIVEMMLDATQKFDQALSKTLS